MVAEKYEGDPKARAYLTNKIIKGGSGVWGEEIPVAADAVWVRTTRASRREQTATAERSEPRLGEIGRRGDQLIP